LHGKVQPIEKKKRGGMGALGPAESDLRSANCIIKIYIVGREERNDCLLRG